MKSSVVVAKLCTKPMQDYIKREFMKRHYSSNKYSLRVRLSLDRRELKLQVIEQNYLSWLPLQMNETVKCMRVLRRTREGHRV